MEKGNHEKLSAEVDTVATLLAFRSSQAGNGYTVPPPPTPDSNEQQVNRGETIAYAKPNKGWISTGECLEHQHSCGSTTPLVSSLPHTLNASSNVAVANASQLLSDAVGSSAAKQLMPKCQDQATLRFGQLASFNSLAHALSPFFLPQNPLSTNQTHGFEQKGITQQDIRKEEVEKALRSKPQRGRKRSNLNRDERQELARSRNREHAKSTRMRKKQRLEQLLKMESSYVEVMQREQLKQSRLAAVRELLQHRQERHFSQSQGCQKSHSSNDDCSGRGPYSLLSYSCLTKSPSTCQCDFKAIEQMDLALYDHAAQQHGPQIQIEIRYSDLALCIEAESATMLVHIRIPEIEVLLKSTLTKVVFAGDSDSIAAVHETILHDLTTTTSDESGLQGQPSHPSVISLDDKGIQVATKAVSGGEGDDCGLFI